MPQMRINQVCTHFHNPFPLPVEPFGCQVSSLIRQVFLALAVHLLMQNMRDQHQRMQVLAQENAENTDLGKGSSNMSPSFSLSLHPCTFPSNNMFFPLAVRLQPLQPEKPHTPIWWWQWLTPHKPQRGRIWYDTFFRRTMLTRIG